MPTVRPVSRKTIVPRGMVGIAARTMSRNPKSPLPAIPASIRDRSIVLVGLMGSGKSTIGRRLAQRLGMRFADADDEIERAAGMTISDIFARFGEAHFRDGERRVISRLLAGRPMVLATGGGAFVNEETRALILQDSLCIWLDADIPTLVERVGRRSHRPLLKNRDPGEVLRELAAVRNPIYAEAHLRVSSASTPHDHTVRAILEALATWKS
jgi:shikimate kinase